MAKNEKTSSEVSKAASAILRARNSTKRVKSVAGSALTQAPDKGNKKKP